MQPSVHQSITAVWRIESARIVASVARLVRDIGVAEDLAQDALVAALEHWPAQGLPDNPGAWLMTTAKRKALDAVRQAIEHPLLERKNIQGARGILLNFTCGEDTSVDEITSAVEISSSSS